MSPATLRNLLIVTMSLAVEFALTAQRRNLTKDKGNRDIHEGHLDMNEDHTLDPTPAPFGVVEGCNKSEMSYYVMGYSFLMKEAWRVKTACGLTSLSADSLASVVKMLHEEHAFSNETHHCIQSVRSRHLMPVVARGARRGWYVQRTRVHESKDHPRWDMQALDLSSTSLGAVPDESAEIYAVIFPLSEQQLHELDSREYGYPAWIDTQRLRLLYPHDSIPRCSMVRWYPIKPSLVHIATEVHPIVMSEVDLVVGGAAEIAHKRGLSEFPKNVIRTIYGWSPKWVNDRPRPFAPWDLDAIDVTRYLVEVATENENMKAGTEEAASVDESAIVVERRPLISDEGVTAKARDASFAGRRTLSPDGVVAVKANVATAVGNLSASPDVVVATQANEVTSTGSVLAPSHGEENEASLEGVTLTPELLQSLTISIMEDIDFPHPRTR